MGRNRNHTGSERLGEWLKRKRAGRTLKEISKLSKTEPLSSLVREISVPTLCLIESGHTMPSAESVYTLATLFRCTTDEIHEIINERRPLAKAAASSASDKGTIESYLEALHAGRYRDAAVVAHQCESSSENERDRILWHARRAVCLPHLGRTEQAIRMLRQCVESSVLGPELLFKVLRNLSDAYYMNGELRSAGACLREALSVAPVDTPVAQRLPLLTSSIFLTLVRLQQTSPIDQRELQEVRQLLREARSVVTAGDDQWKLLLDLYAAAAEELAGNTPVAARDYKAVAQEAARIGNKHGELAALEFLGVLRRKQGRYSEAERYLTMAESRALESTMAERVFDIAFELLLVAQATKDGDKERLYFRKCQRHYPLVSRRSPHVMRFEQLLREVE